MLLLLHSASIEAFALTRLGRIARPRASVTASIDDDASSGKFARYGDDEREVPATFGELGVLTAGLDEEALGTLGDIIDANVQQGLVPIVVLTQAEMRQPLREVLKGMLARDCVIPATPASVQSPLVLFSGLEEEALRSVVGTLAQARTAGLVPRDVVFACAVPRAMDKSVGAIYNEVLGDQRANAR
jgi:hypothetical protein